MFIVCIATPSKLLQKNKKTHLAEQYQKYKDCLQFSEVITTYIMKCPYENFKCIKYWETNKLLDYGP